MTSKTRSRSDFIPNFDRYSVLLIAALALTATTAAQAQANTPPARLAPAAGADTIPQNRTSAADVEAAFNRADTNHDGKLTRQESERFPAVALRFEQIDANQDAFISREEFNKAAGS